MAIEAGAAGNTVGGTASGATNVISGNTQYGVYLDGTGTAGNLILGNLIGTNAASDTGLGNLYGVFIGGSASGNTVGGTVTGAKNVISGNSYHGIEINASNANLVQGNFIGTNSSGTAVLGNLGSGVDISSGSSANTVGGTASGAANVVSGNLNGVYLYGGGTSDNVVLGNLIGTNADGTAALPNNGHGVLVESGPAANTIGGTASGASNVISGNGGPGLVFWLHEWQRGAGQLHRHQRRRHNRPGQQLPRRGHRQRLEKHHRWHGHGRRERHIGQ